MLFIVGIEKYPNQCVIQRVNTEKGKYLLPITFKDGFYEDWIQNLERLIHQELPDQIIFDEYGTGAAFKDIFLGRMFKSGLIIYENGDVIY